MTKYDFYWIASIPDSTQSHPHALQTPSRHPPDTSQTPQNLALFGCGRKGNSLIWRLLFNCLWSIWHLNSPRHFLDTPRYDPDSLRHPHTPSRPPQTDIGTLRIRRQRKKRDYLSWHDYTFLPTNLVLIHFQTPSDLTKTLPDTIQTPQDIRHFHAIQGSERKCNNSLT